MKIYQAPAVFKPIHVELETKREAGLFISIIDKIDGARNNANTPPDITQEEYALVVKISDWFTSQTGFR